MRRCALALIAALLAPALSAQDWLRVEHPGAALRANLPPQAIDYGHFIWMPAAGAPVSLLGARVQV